MKLPNFKNILVLRDGDKVSKYERAMQKTNGIQTVFFRSLLRETKKDLCLGLLSLAECEKGYRLSV